MDNTDKDLDLIRHMVGAQSHIPKRQWGFRNHFCSSEDGTDYECLKRLEAAGYVFEGSRLAEGVYFHATKAGCQAIGLKPAQMKRAIHDG